MSTTFRLEPFWRVILREVGLSGESLARWAGLPTNLFASNPVMVDVDGWASLWDALEAEVDRPDLALVLGQRITLDMFDPAVFAAFCSDNLEQAAARLQLYKRLMGPCRLRLERKGTLSIACDVVGLPHPPRLWSAGELVAWVALARHCTQHRIVPARVVMPLDVADPDPFEAFFGVGVSRGEGYQVVFEAADALRAFVSTDASMWSFFEPVLRRRLAELDETTSMTERVAAALAELLPSGRSQIGDVASALGMSPRSIQRRLGQEHVTFRDILDKTRLRLAQHYLMRTQLTTTEVAFLIGFDDPNSLYPAFRAWTGTTPQAVRDAAHRAD
jgi:AraC-like DNA-binding protein